jgi:hypothetical protein
MRTVRDVPLYARLKAGPYRSASSFCFLSRQTKSNRAREQIGASGE